MIHHPVQLREATSTIRIRSSFHFQPQASDTEILLLSLFYIAGEFTWIYSHVLKYKLFPIKILQGGFIIYAIDI